MFARSVGGLLRLHIGCLLCWRLEQQQQSLLDYLLFPHLCLATDKVVVEWILYLKNGMEKWAGEGHFVCAPRRRQRKQLEILLYFRFNCFSCVGPAEITIMFDWCSSVTDSSHFWTGYIKFERKLRETAILRVDPLKMVYYIPYFNHT